MIKADWKNHKIEIRLKNFNNITRKSIEHAFHEIGKDLKKTAKKLIKDKRNKTGRIYLVRLKGRLVKHRASAPGEAVADLTGNYRRSVDVEISGADKLIFGAGGRDTKVNYVKFTELGTKKMAPRPTLRKAIEKNYKNIEERINTFIVKGNSKK